MYVQKLYHQDGPLKGQVRAWKVGHTGYSARQNFRERDIHQGLADGFMAISGDRLLIKAEPESLQYRILRKPGRYCNHCRLFLRDDGDLGAEMRTHVAKEHKDQDAPADGHYVWLKHYECELNSAQHMKFRAQPGDPLTLDHVARDVVRAARAKKALKVLTMLGFLITGLALMVFGSPPDAGIIISGNIIYNIALGRVAELYNRVDLSDPTNAVLLVVAIAAGTTTDAAFRDFDTLAASLPGGGGAAEATNSGYARKSLSDADIVAFSPDDTNDRVDLVIPDQTWVGVAAGTNWTDLIIAYDSDSGAGTDSAVVPLTLHDFVVTPDGSDITADVPTAGFFRAIQQ